MDKIHPEKLPYWKTGQSSPDIWIEKAINLIVKFGAKLQGQAYGHDASTGDEAFMIAFSTDEENYRITWPIPQPKYEKDRGAAKRQAATMLYHDVKARLLYAEIHGFRNAFLPMLLVSGNGRKLPLGQIATPELTQEFPKLLTRGRRSYVD